MGDETRIEIGPEVRALLEELGLKDEFENVRKIEIYPREVKVEIYLPDAERSNYIDPETGEPRTDTRRIFVTMDGSSS